MNTYVTDTAAATVLTALGLPSTLTEAQAQILDAEAVYVAIQENEFSTDDQMTAWAKTTWGDTTDSQTRLTNALALLQRAGRVVSFPSEWQPSIPGLT